MSVWTTKALDRERNYILLIHNLRGVNLTIHGVKFRDSYAVVEKDSKKYYHLKRLPNLKNAKEIELKHLRNLPFISRPLDVKMVYGQDVYLQYLKEIQPLIDQNKKEPVIKEEIEDRSSKCNYVLDNGDLCGCYKLPNSPSGYCKTHLLKDPLLEELGIEIPKYLSKNQRKKVIESVVRRLNKVSKKKMKEITS